MKETIKTISLFILFIPVIIALVMIGPIAQPLHYHNFADSRTMAGIPNFFDTVSNIAFIIAGIYGLLYIISNKTIITDIKRFKAAERLPYYTFFISMILIGFGSFYYHMQPDNFRLVFDRIPMATAFISFSIIIINERITNRGGTVLLILLLLLGISSVIYWYYTETIGRGDLRIYMSIQYLPIIMIIIITLLYPAKYTKSSYIFFILLLYTGAKVFEFFDREIFTSIEIISGHTIKHIFAAIASWLVLFLIKKDTKQKNSR